MALKVEQRTEIGISGVTYFEYLIRFLIWPRLGSKFDVLPFRGANLFWVHNLSMMLIQRVFSEFRIFYEILNQPDMGTYQINISPFEGAQLT